MNLPHTLILEFKQGNNTREISRKIWSVYWFATFGSGERSLEDEPRLWSWLDFDDDGLKSLVESLRRQNTRRLAKMKNTWQFTLYRQIGNVSKLGVGFSHALNVYESLIRGDKPPFTRNKPFLEYIIISNRKTNYKNLCIRIIFWKSMTNWKKGFWNDVHRPLV